MMNLKQVCEASAFSLMLQHAVSLSDEVLLDLKLQLSSSLDRESSRARKLSYNVIDIFGP